MTDLSGFVRKDLETAGFVGWTSAHEASTDKVDTPDGPGVYVVYSDRRAPGEFLATNPAGWYKGEDPTVPVALLEERWIADAGALYFGAAMDLRKRLARLGQFSAGEPVAHYGGRILWQVAFSDEFLVAWKPSDDGDPASEKKRYVKQFKSTFGRQPFANIQRPRT